MNGIKGNEVILDTLLSTNDMANYEKNFNEMSSLYKLPIITANFTPTCGNNANYQIQSNISTSNSIHTLSDESLKIENGIIKIDPEVYQGAYFIVQYTFQLGTTATTDEIFYGRLRYYTNDNYSTPYEYQSSLRMQPYATLISGQSCTFTFAWLITPASPITGYSIELCNVRGNTWNARGQSNIMLIGIQNNL